MRLCAFASLSKDSLMKKQSQNRPLAGNPKRAEWERLKKQSQFTGGHIVAIHVITIVYGDYGDLRHLKNKAKQTQFQITFYS
jgi:hypothetical protein